MVGKLPPDDLGSHVLQRTGESDDRVRQGAAYGEDAAAIDLGEETLVVSTDPISLAAERVGTLGVPVACNDVAASGADPAWLTATVFVPESDQAVLAAVTEQLDEAARVAGVQIVGGHTEYAPERDRPLLSLTAFGLAERFVPSGGAEPGDRVLLTKGAGIEGTAILATDFREAALDRGVDEATVERAAGFFDEISIAPEARILREFATAMHDPTEGGLVDGLLEVAAASGTDVVVDREAVPVCAETGALCEAMDVDPLAIFGSGALLATVPEGPVEPALSALDEAGIDAAIVGEVRDVSEDASPALVLDGERYAEPERDDLYALWADDQG